jgi:TRAP transporter TAXI family solute receptor
MGQKRARIGAGLAAGAIAVALAGAASAQTQSGAQRANRGAVEIVTGGVDGTDLRIAADLSAVLDDGTTRRVVPVVGKGSLQNLFDLRSLRGIDMALVQIDALNAAKTQRLVPGIEGAATYVAKLYNVEFHLLAKQNVKSIQDLQGKKVNFEVAGSGTAVTGPRLFQMLKIPVEATSFDNAAALEKLKSGEIAAMAYVAGKPAPLFIDPRLPQGLRLVPIPLQPELLNEYLPSRFTAEDYPSLLQGPDTVDTIAVGTALMVAALAPETERYKNVAHFVDAFFTQFPKFLEAPRHQKWKEVNLAAELPGWRRYPPADAWLKKNATTGPVLAEPELRDVFSKFLDERSRVSGGRSLTAQQKNDMFEQFQRWQSSTQGGR